MGNRFDYRLIHKGYLTQYIVIKAAEVGRFGRWSMTANNSADRLKLATRPSIKHLVFPASSNPSTFTLLGSSMMASTSDQKMHRSSIRSRK